MTDSGNPQVDVAALAALARLDVTAEELAKLQQEIPDILGFVTEVNTASVSSDKGAKTLRNVMREDDNETPSGTHTEDILSNAPEREGDYFKVPQVIKR